VYGSGAPCNRSASSSRPAEEIESRPCPATMVLSSRPAMTPCLVVVRSATVPYPVLWRPAEDVATRPRPAAMALSPRPAMTLLSEVVSVAMGMRTAFPRSVEEMAPSPRPAMTPRLEVVRPVTDLHPRPAEEIELGTRPKLLRRAEGMTPGPGPGPGPVSQPKDRRTNPGSQLVLLRPALPVEKMVPSLYPALAHQAVEVAAEIALSPSLLSPHKAEEAVSLSFIGVSHVPFGGMRGSSSSA